MPLSLPDFFRVTWVGREARIQIVYVLISLYGLAKSARHCCGHVRTTRTTDMSKSMKRELPLGTPLKSLSTLCTQSATSLIRLQRMLLDLDSLQRIQALMRSKATFLPRCLA